MSANWSHACRSGGRARWAATRPFVARPQFALRDVERGRQLLREVVGQGDLAALNTSHELRGYSSSGAEHRLRHASNNTPVAGESLALRDIDEISNGDAEDVGDARKQIDLGRRRAFLPPANRLGFDVREAGDFSLRDTRSQSRLFKSLGPEPAHYPSTHRSGLGPNAKFVIGRHCAALSLQCAHTGSYRSHGLEVGHVRGTS